MGRPIRSEGIRTGENAELNQWDDRRYVRCSRCGFICHLDRDIHSTNGSRMGWGIRYDDADVNRNNGSSFIDSSDSARTITPHAGSVISTSTYKFGSQSCQFDGVRSYLSAKDSADFNFGTGNFAIRFWVNFASTAGAQVFVSHYSSNSNLLKVQKNNSTNALLIQATSDGSTKALYTMTDSWSPSAGTWYCLEFCRISTTAKIFIDGTSQTLTESTAFGTNDIGDVDGPLFIGQAGNSSGYVNGYMDSIQILSTTGNTANYTAPTTAYTSTSATELLLNFEVQQRGLVDPVVVGGCPQCGTYLYNS